MEMPTRLFYRERLGVKLKRLYLRSFDSVHPVFRDNVVDVNKLFADIAREVSNFDRQRLSASPNSQTMTQLFASYIKEIWLSEFPPEATLDTGIVVELLLARDYDGVRDELNRANTKDAPGVCRLLINLLNAAHYLLGQDFLTYRQDPLTVDLVTEVHSKHKHYILVLSSTMLCNN